MTDTLLDIRARGFLARQEAEGVWPSGGGLAVSLVHNGTRMLSAGYGCRERDRNLPVTPDTVFAIGSLTKAFTATALSIAADTGRVDLQSPINQSRTLLALSDPDVMRQISIADILSHRTGVPSHDLLWYLGGFGAKELRRKASLLETVPGAFRRTFSYNNLLYGVLGELFEEQVGERMESYVGRTILAPLRMTSTSYDRPTDPENVALPYVGTTRAMDID